MMGHKFMLFPVEVDPDVLLTAVEVSTEAVDEILDCYSVYKDAVRYAPITSVRRDNPSGVRLVLIDRTSTLGERLIYGVPFEITEADSEGLREAPCDRIHMHVGTTVQFGVVMGTATGLDGCPVTVVYETAGEAVRNVYDTLMSESDAEGDSEDEEGEVDEG